MINRYWYDRHDGCEVCPHDDLSEWWLDEVGWLDSESSMWYEIWRQECGDCGYEREDYVEEVRIEITAREEMEHAA